MFKLLTQLIHQPLINTILNRLINRYTGSGLIIVLMQLESMGILPKGVTQAVNGLGTKEVLIYVCLGIGIYLIIHKPNFKSKLERKQEELKIRKIELKLEKTKKNK